MIFFSCKKTQNVLRYINPSQHLICLLTPACKGRYQNEFLMPCWQSWLMGNSPQRESVKADFGLKMSHSLIESSHLGRNCTVGWFWSIILLCYLPCPTMSLCIISRYPWPDWVTRPEISFETDTETFFETKYFWDRYRYFFSRPNDFETDTETFFRDQMFLRLIPILLQKLKSKIAA